MTGIAEIENGMLARLRAAGDAEVLGYKFKTLESYPEEFDAHLREKIKADTAFPAAWAVFGGWRQPTDTGQVLEATAVFMLVVAARNLRNETAQRHGVDTAKGREVGSYQLMMDAASLLHGSRLGLDIGGLKLGPCRSIRPTAAVQERKVSMFALEFTVPLPIEVAAFPAGDLADFQTFNADWDVRPFGGVDGDLAAPGVQLPAPADGPGAADATDTMEVPQ